MRTNKNDSITSKLDKFLNRITDYSLNMMQPHIILTYGIIALILLWIFLLFMPPPTLPTP